MLNRIKYILIALLLSACLVKPALAVNDSTISYVSINDKVYEDVELMITDGAQILVPFKQLADIFQIEYSANRVDKLIIFKTHDGIEGEINSRGVFIDKKSIQKGVPIFLAQGIMDNVMNEAFITAESAEKIFGIQLDTDYSTITINAQIDRDIPILHYFDKQLSNDKGPKANPDVILPKKGGKITLNKIGIRANMINDNVSTDGPQHHIINDTISGNTFLTAKGDIFNGKYRVNSNFYHSRTQEIMFGGLSATYINSFMMPKSKKRYYYEIGRVTGRRDVDASLGTNIFGAQIWNYDYDRESPRNLNGYVKPTSLVRVTVNDNEPVTLSTYSGYYQVSDMQLPTQISSIKIEEVNEDGTIELVKEEKYSLYGDRPVAKEHRSSAYAGVWGYQNRLFRDGSNIYRGNNKKVTAGIDYQYGIRDNVTFETKLVGDKIYEKTQSSIFYTIPTNDALLVTGTQKNVNYLEGATTLNSVEYVNKKDPNFKARATIGGSVAKDIRDEDTHVGYIVKGTTEYRKDLRKHSWKIFQPKSASTKVELFQTSPDFYIASSDSTSKNDRIGGKATGSFSFNNASVSGGYTKYYSNINNRYDGGTINFDQYNINASAKVPYLGTVRYSRFQRRGSNDLGRNKNYNHELNLIHDFGRWARFQAGRRENVYDTRYIEPTTINRNYNSKFGDTYMKLDVPLPKNLGKFTMGHNFVDYNSGGYKNDYNMFRFGYTFPTWKRMTWGLGWGFRYHGQEGQDFSVRMGYKAKSGQMITVGYQYSQNGGYFIDNMFMPTTNRHSVNVIFNDAYQLFHNGFRSIGDDNSEKGIFELLVYIDTNNNGKYDKKDVLAKDIPVSVSWSVEPEYTNKKGKITSPALSNGVYNIALDMNTLPITVAPASNDLISKTIKIEDGLTTKFELPLVSTVGSVSGKLKISDDFERDLKITDFIVVILDEEGNEINYSTVDSTGEYYISGLAPGKYIVQLDERFVDAYGLEKIQNLSERTIFIPYDYDNPIDVINQNIEYRTLSL